MARYPEIIQFNEVGDQESRPITFESFRERGHRFLSHVL